MRFVARSVNTALARETGVSSRNTMRHISVALANRFGSYPVPCKPAVAPVGAAIFSPSCVSAVLGLTSVYIVTKRSLAL